MRIAQIHRSDIVTRLRDSGSVFAEDEAELLISTVRSLDELARMVNRRVAGLPLESILGWNEFYGSRIIVEPGVFVPFVEPSFWSKKPLLRHAPRTTSLSTCTWSYYQVGITFDKLPHVVYFFNMKNGKAVCNGTRGNYKGHFPPMPVPHSTSWLPTDN